jgi:hypothetical protein
MPDGVSLSDQKHRALWPGGPHCPARAKQPLPLTMLPLPTPPQPRPALPTRPQPTRPQPTLPLPTPPLAATDCGQTASTALGSAARARRSRFPPISRSTSRPAGPARTCNRPSGAASTRTSGGFRGCAVYDCFGAGQHVSQITFGGRDWRQSPDTARQMFDAFAIMRQLHELLWYVAEALASKRSSPSSRAERRLRCDEAHGEQPGG